MKILPLTATYFKLSIKICKCLLLIIAALVLQISLYAQQKKPSKINDIFFQYVTETLQLNPSEAAQMRPLVKTYLTERKKITANAKDPLEREKQVLALKMGSRKQMARIIGMKRANYFFTSEQSFRRKVREELKSRKQQGKKN